MGQFSSATVMGALQECKAGISPSLSFSAQNCSGLRTCSQCLEQPECGWCGDPSSTGKGLCLEGSYRGPMKRLVKQGQQGQAHVPSQDLSLEPGSCPRDKGYEWAFIHCPGKPPHPVQLAEMIDHLSSAHLFERLLLPIDCYMVLSLKRCSYQGFLLHFSYATNPSLRTPGNQRLVCHLMLS